MSSEAFWKNVKESSPFIRPVDVGRIVGATPSAAARWMREKKLPRVDQIVTLAKALGTTVEELTKSDEVKA